MAAPGPDGAQPASRVKRCARWLRNDQGTAEGYGVPSSEVLVTPLALPTLVVGREGSVVGRGGVARMRPVVDQGRALPLAWLVRSGQPGHGPAAWPLPLRAQVHQRRPAGAPVVLRGDGAGDGTRLQHTGQAYHGSSGVRTGRKSIVVWDGERFRCDTVAACLQPGPLGTCTDGRVTEEA